MRSILIFLFLSACAGEIAPGEDLKLFRDSMVSELSCGFAADRPPCDIVGWGNAEKGSLEVYNCHVTRIWDRPENSTTHYTIYGRGGSMFDNQATWNMVDINLPRADPKMVALIEQAQRLDCRFQGNTDSRPETDHSTCQPATCIAVLKGDQIVISKRP
jgi:hypothetical protein